MLIIGCDWQTRFEQVAMLRYRDGRAERRLEHENGEGRPLTSDPAVVRSCALLVPLWVEQLRCLLPALELPEAALQQLFQRHAGH